MFEHPWKRGWPSSYRSRDDRCDDGEDSEAIFVREVISNRFLNKRGSLVSEEEKAGDSWISPSTRMVRML